MNVKWEHSCEGRVSSVTNCSLYTERKGCTVVLKNGHWKRERAGGREEQLSTGQKTGNVGADVKEDGGAEHRRRKLSALFRARQIAVRLLAAERAPSHHAERLTAWRSRKKFHGVVLFFGRPPPVSHEGFQSLEQY